MTPILVVKEHLHLHSSLAVMIWQRLLIAFTDNQFDYACAYIERSESMTVSEQLLTYPSPPLTRQQSIGDKLGLILG